MPRDYAKRSNQGRPKSETRSSMRVPRRTPTSRPPLRPQAVGMQARRVQGRNKPKRHFPWRRLFLLSALLIVFILALLALRFGAGRINHFFQHAPASVETSTVMTSLPPPVVATAPPVTSFVFEPAPLAKTEASKRYKLQLGTFTDGDDLTVLENALNKIGMKYHRVKLARADAFYYRIEVGGFSDEATAFSTQQLLRHHKIFAVVT